ncbi:MAG: hypothetical protein J6W52_02290 [Bacteroidaceae bacterium]|nr:hypothetical protein [Bacteroidaceae bacterium]
MKGLKILFLFAMFNALCSVFNELRAQDENAAFYIYQNDGHFDGFFYDEVLKMSYSKTDTAGVEYDVFVTQEIVTVDSTYRIMLSAIDSIGFVQPEIRYNPKLRRVDEQRYGITWYEYDSFFSVYVPSWLSVTEDELPHVGDVFVNFDPEEGWSGKVVSITKVYSNEYETDYQVQCEPITDITDIFQQFVSIEEYSYDDTGNMVRRRVAGCPDLNVGRFRRKAEGTWEGDIFNFSLSGHLPLYYSDDLTMTVDPSIEGKLHLKTAWNLSLWGDKYISIHSKLDFGVGLSFTIDGKIMDFFPGGIGGLVGGVPIPATCPIIMLDITPDAFLRGEAHVNFRLNSPKLKGAMWSRLEINNWVPSLTMGFGNSDDGSAFESVDNSGSKVTMSLNGFVQGGMLYPMKFKSLPVLKKIFDSEIGGQWFVGPKLAADFTLDMTTMPWLSTAAYTQLKNITLQMHLLDADYEVKGTVKTAFSGKKEVTLADGSTSIFPPFDASFVPEFDDVADYDTITLIGGELVNCRAIAFKPSGYVIKPVDVGVALFDVKEDNTIDYNEFTGHGGLKMYYHFAQLFGQKLDKRLWPKYEIPYLIGKSMGDMGQKKRAVPFVLLNGCYLFAPNSYDFNTEPIFEANGNTWVTTWDGTVKTPVRLTGYIDSINYSPNYNNPYEYNTDYYHNPPSYLKFQGGGADGENGKKTLTATVNLENYEKYYHPIDTLKYGYVLGVEKKIQDKTYSWPFEMKTFTLPCPQDPVLTNISISTIIYSALEESLWSGIAELNLYDVKPNTTITRLSRSNDFPNGGWHVVADYEGEKKKAHISFDIVCRKQSNTFEIKNSQISYSASYEQENEMEARCSVSGSMDGILQHKYYWGDYWRREDTGLLGETFSMKCEKLRGTYYEKYRGYSAKTVSPLFEIIINFAYE